MQLTENILLRCSSSLGELLLREGGQRFYPTLSFAFHAKLFSVLLPSTEYENEKTLYVLEIAGSKKHSHNVSLTPKLTAVAGTAGHYSMDDYFTVH